MTSVSAERLSHQAWRWRALAKPWLPLAECLEGAVRSKMKEAISSLQRFAQSNAKLSGRPTSQEETRAAERQVAVASSVAT